MQGFCYNSVYNEFVNLDNTSLEERYVRQKDPLFILSLNEETMVTTFKIQRVYHIRTTTEDPNDIQFYSWFDKDFDRHGSIEPQYLDQVYRRRVVSFNCDKPRLLKILDKYLQQRLKEKEEELLHVKQKYSLFQLENNIED